MNPMPGPDARGGGEGQAGRARAAARAARAAVAVVLGAALGAGAVRVLSGPADPRPAAAAEDARRDATVRAIEKVAPAVANISTERVVVVRSPFFHQPGDPFEDFFRDFAPPRRMRQTSLGSGFSIDPEGYVLTNAHVVARASKIVVSFPGRPELEARLVNISAEHDLALLKVDDEQPLPVAPLGTSADALLGETAIALGNPFGLANSVTRGVLSAKDRALGGGGGGEEDAAGRPRFHDFLQTDAAINPGNSGGPLIDVEGRVIGVNTAIMAEGRGIGFAIPIDRAKEVLLALCDVRELQGAFTGLGALEDEPAGGGARVAAVIEGSPAAKAGLRPGDVVVGVDGRRAAWRFDVLKRLIDLRPGEAVRLAVRGPGGGAPREVDLTLAAAPETPGERLASLKLGLRVKRLTELLAQRAGVGGDARGVLVVRAEADGPGGLAGVQAGDVITRLGRPVPVRGLGHRIEVYPIRDLDDLARFLVEVGVGERLVVFVVREGHELRGELVAR